MRIFFNIIKKITRLANFKLQELMLLRRDALSNEDDAETLQELETVRKMAFQEGHIIEEFVLLLDEYQQTFSSNEEELKRIKGDIYALYPCFSQPDETFKEWFDTVYLAHKPKAIHKQTYEFIRIFVSTIQGKADFMSAHLDYKTSLVCCQAMFKLSSLGCIQNEHILEIIYTFAVNYGNIADFDSAMRYYDMAIQLANDSKDDTLLYVALMRKWSICEFAQKTHPAINLDIEQTETLGRLLDLSAKHRRSLRELGAFFISVEQRNRTTTRDMRQFRIARVKEAKPMLDLLVSLYYGDTKNAQTFVGELKEGETEAYGKDIGYTNAEQATAMYMRYFDSPSRRNSTEVTLEDENSDEEVEDPGYMPDFPKDMFPKDKFMQSIQYARDFAIQNMFVSAGNMCEYAFDLASKMHSDYSRAIALFTMAQVQEVQKEDAEAIKLYEATLGILRNQETGSDADLSPNLQFSTLSMLGNLMAAYDLGRAIAYFTEAIDNTPMNTSVRKSHVSWLYLNRADSYRRKGYTEEAEADLEQAMATIMNEAKLRLPYMEAEIREMYWEEVQGILGKAVSMVDNDSSTALKQVAYNAVLFSKGILLSAEKTVKTILETNPEFESLRSVYKDVKRYEDTLFSWGTQTEESTKEYVERYEKKTHILLAIQEKAASYFAFLDYAFTNVRESLYEGQVLIDYFDYELEDGDQQYVAFVITRDNPTPILIKLCKESDLSRIFEDAKDDSTLYEVYNPRKKYSFELSKALWKPIEETAHVSLGSEIFIVPSGSLAKIPIESLPIVEGKDVVLSEYFRKFARLSHARALSINKDREFNSITLFGGLDYGLGSDDTDDKPESRGYRVDSFATTPAGLQTWRYLEGTKREVEAVANQMQNLCSDIRVFKGGEGTVTSFKELSGNTPDIIHIATHGFFETRESSVNLPALRSANPMSLSGLILSNGNEGWLNGTPKNHEGIITAAEIAHMQLPCQMVVLSACETGEGVVKSDGVYGLQRGFKKAGVGCLIMSLWNLDDMGGQAFMQLFYKKLSEGSDRYKAFYEAKHQIKNAFADMPFMWAGIIMLD